MYKYYKQLKEPVGQQRHLGRKYFWTSRIVGNSMQRVLDKFLAVSRYFIIDGSNLYFDTEFRVYFHPNNLKSERIYP